MIRTSARRAVPLMPACPDFRPAGVREAALPLEGRRPQRRAVPRPRSGQEGRRSMQPTRPAAGRRGERRLQALAILAVSPRQSRCRGGRSGAAGDGRCRQGPRCGLRARSSWRRPHSDTSSPSTSTVSGRTRPSSSSAKSDTTSSPVRATMGHGSTSSMSGRAAPVSSTT